MVSLVAYAFDPQEFKSRDEVLAEFETTFKKGSITEFFEKRDADPALAQCRSWLKKATAAYEKATAAGDLEEMDNVLAGSGEGAEYLKYSYSGVVDDEI
jgi:hypothetical protein